MVTAIFLPFLEQISKKSINSFLKIQVSMNIKIPHFRTHLNEEVHHACRWSEHHFCIICDYTTSNSIPQGPHFIHLASDTSCTEFNFLIQINTGVYQTVLQSPHFTTTKVLILKCEFNRIKSNIFRIHNIHVNISVCSKLESCSNTLLHTNCIFSMQVFFQFCYL